MYSEFDIAGLDELEALADGLESYTSRTGQHSVYRHTTEAVTRSLNSDVERAARRRAREHVGDDAATIDARVLGWVGRSLNAGLNTDSEVVLAHEFGSGEHGGGGAYRIEPDDGDVMAFTVNGTDVVVDHVVHPGVRGKRFLRNTAQQKAGAIGDEIKDELVDTLGDATDPHL